MRQLRWIVPLVAGVGVGAAGWLAQQVLARRQGDLAAPEVLLPTLLALVALFGGPLVGLAIAVQQAGRLARERRRVRAIERRTVPAAFHAPEAPPAPSPDVAPADQPGALDPPSASAPRHPSIFDG